MAVQDFYDVNVPSENIDIRTSNRKTQTSIIIKQDENKAGFLSFLKQQEIQSEQAKQNNPSDTIRPRRQSGGY